MDGRGSTGLACTRLVCCAVAHVVVEYSARGLTVQCSGWNEQSDGGMSTVVTPNRSRVGDDSSRGELTVPTGSVADCMGKCKVMGVQCGVAMDNKKTTMVGRGRLCLGGVVCWFSARIASAPSWRRRAGQPHSCRMPPAPGWFVHAHGTVGMRRRCVCRC